MWGRSPILRGLATIILFLSLEVVSILLIANDSVFQRVKISGALMYFKSSISSATSDVRYYFGLKEKNEILLNENQQLREQLSKYKTKAEMADTLEGFSSVNPDFTYIPAKIISNSTNKLNNYIIINRGRRHGVQKDMGVISPVGVVGVVSSVSDNYSYIISFLNINQSVSARIEPSGAFGPLSWEGRSSDYATLTQVPYHIRVSVGDTVFTSGFSTLYPPDVPLGTIRRSSVIMGTHHSFQVKLFQNFNSLRYVSVVVNNKKEELNQFIQENEVKR
ncbi:MAG: rod shape-determining protein MreC [Bacteroidetes bacterium HGW-Bacteroidetes-7]|jgi:rod shape-determining protein MreC|nr:MAG: rod shape-determining protein MreC [Bacteroidetes bacterium HGW-Bacteroidetes-7]